MKTIKILLGSFSVALVTVFPVRAQKSASLPYDQQMDVVYGEVHGTGFADEARPVFFENPIAIDQDAPETLDVFRVVGRVVPILIEGSIVVELHRIGIDAHFDSGL